MNILLSGSKDTVAKHIASVIIIAVCLLGSSTELGNRGDLENHGELGN